MLKLFQVIILLLFVVQSRGGKLNFYYHHLELTTSYFIMKSSDDAQDQEDELPEADDYSDEPVVLGDLHLTPKQYNYMFTKNLTKRNGLKDSIFRWPNGNVKYMFDQNLLENTRYEVQRAMKFIERSSCLKFQKTNNPKDNHIFVSNGRGLEGCYSFVGNLRRGRQKLVLQHNCGLRASLHEILHALGFVHMHMMPERDNYIKINYHNIESNRKDQFHKTKTPVNMFNTQYDVGSIMHYEPTAFSIDKYSPTIESKVSGVRMGREDRKLCNLMWTRSNFDFTAWTIGDVQRLNRMYNCPNTPKVLDL